MDDIAVKQPIADPAPTLTVFDETGKSYEIPNNQESMNDALSKGYKTTQDQETVVTKPAFVGPEKEEGVVPVLDEDGKIYHIPDNKESIQDAKDKGYKLQSDVKSEQDKYNKYSEQFKNTNQYGQAAAYGAEQIPANIANVIETTAGVAFNPIGTAIKAGINAISPGAIPTNEDLQHAVFAAGEKGWEGIPDKYISILRSSNVPPEDRKIAAQALQDIEEKQPGVNIPLIGKITGPGLLEGAIANAPEAIAAGGAEQAVAGGIKSALGRFAAKTAVQTAVFNGPEALKNAIVDGDPALAAENLFRGAILNTGLNAIGAGLGATLKGAKFVAENALLSPEEYAAKFSPNTTINPTETAIKPGVPPEIPTTGSTFSTAAANLGNMVFSGGKDIDNVAAAYMRENGANEISIDEAVRSGNATKYVANTEKYLAKELADPNYNNAKIGRGFKRLHDEGGEEIAKATVDLDRLSEKDSKVKLDEGSQTDQISKDRFIERNFTDDRIQKIADRNFSLNMTEKELKDFEDESKSLALADYQAIRDGSLSKQDYIKREIKKYDEIVSKNPEGEESTATAHSRQNAADQALQKYNLAKGDGISKTELITDVYDARVKADDLTSQIYEHLDPTHSWNRSNEIVNPKSIQFAKQLIKTIDNAADSDGSLSPSAMKKLRTYISDNISEADTGDVNGFKKLMWRYVDDANDIANHKIAALSGDTDVLQRLKVSNEKYQLSELHGQGVPLITKERVTGGTNIGVAMRSHVVGAARIAMKPLYSWLGEKGSREIIRQRYRIAAQNTPLAKLLTEDSTSKVLIDNTVKHREFLSTIPKVLTKVAQASVANRKDAAKDIQSFDGLKALLGDEANGLSKSQQYQRVLDKLTDPHILQNQMDIASQVGNQALTVEMQQKIQVAHELLKSAIKPLSDPQPFTKNSPLKPSEQQINDINDMVRLINNPEELFRDFEAHTINDRKVQIVRTMYPSIYATMVQQADLASSNIHFSLQDRLLYSILHQAPIDASQSMAKDLQQAGQASAAPAQQASGEGNRKPTKEGGSPSYATANQNNIAGVKIKQ